MSNPSRLGALSGVLLFALSWASVAYAEHADPSGRVARFSDIRGEVSYSPAGEEDWISVVRNRPLISGDRLWTDRGARGELQVGSAAVRLGPNTSLEILELDDRIAQFRLTQGMLNLRVRRMDAGQVYEVATPTLAFTVNRAGRYRIDVDPRDNHTTIVVWEGAGTAYGENADLPLRAGDTVRFYDADLRDYEMFGLPREDDFDRYSFARDLRLDRSASLRYVDDDLVGYADLDEYGSWRPLHSYGDVWFPSRIDADWAPYRDGHWVWQEPWGWTWVDDAPWGFAPSHYGRWIFISNHWGWIPGPRHVRAIYAPALVAFVGGSGWSLSISLGGGSPIGWFPLGPREVYVPSYRASRDYFTRVNVNNTVINNTTITNVYNNYERGDVNVTQVNHVNRTVAGAITAVPGDVFRNSRSVRQAAVPVDQNAITTGRTSSVAPIAPSVQSVMGAGNPARARPPRAAIERPVVARHAPPPRERPFAAREEQLQRNPGQVPQPRAVEPAPSPAIGAAPKVRVISGQRTPVDSRAQEPRRRGTEPGADAERIRPRPSRDQAAESETDRRREAGDRDRNEPPQRNPGRVSQPRAVEPVPSPDVDEQSAPVNANRRHDAEPGADAGGIRPQPSRDRAAESDTDRRREADDRDRNEPPQRNPGRVSQPRAVEPVPSPDVDERRAPVDTRRLRGDAQSAPDAPRARPLPPLDRAAESTRGSRRAAGDRNRNEGSAGPADALPSTQRDARPQDSPDNSADNPQKRRRPTRAQDEWNRIPREDPNADTSPE